MAQQSLRISALIWNETPLEVQLQMKEILAEIEDSDSPHIREILRLELLKLLENAKSKSARGA